MPEYLAILEHQHLRRLVLHLGAPLDLLREHGVLRYIHYPDIRAHVIHLRPRPPIGRAVRVVEKQDALRPRRRDKLRDLVGGVYGVIIAHPTPPVFDPCWCVPLLQICIWKGESLPKRKSCKVSNTCPSNSVNRRAQGPDTASATRLRAYRADAYRQPLQV